MPKVRKKLLDRVTTLIERSQEVGISAPTDTGYFSIDPATVEDVGNVLEETAELLREIGDYFEEQIETTDVEEIRVTDETDFLKEIGASISTELASREVADLAFMGRREILDLHRSFRSAVEQQNFWKIVARADAGLGRAVRALVPIESAMREYEGLPALRRRWKNLEDSLEIRRQYGLLWRAARRTGEPQGDELEVALRKIGHRIAILRQLKIYPFLRIDDRLAIRRLQKRIHNFLQAPEDQDGRQLWTDVVSFFGLLKQVNNRHEVREHDRNLVLTMQYDLSRDRDPGDRISRKVLERLEPLFGRDDELDHLLRHPASYRPGDCLEILSRLRDELLRSDAPAAVIL